MIVVSRPAQTEKVHSRRTDFTSLFVLQRDGPIVASKVLHIFSSLQTVSLKKGEGTSICFLFLFCQGQNNMLSFPSIYPTHLYGLKVKQHIHLGLFL